MRVWSILNRPKTPPFEKAEFAIRDYLDAGADQVELFLSDTEPQVHPSSGEFRAVYREQKKFSQVFWFFHFLIFDGRLS